MLLQRLKVTSKKLKVCRPVSMVILRPNVPKNAWSSFLRRSKFCLDILSWWPSPSSRYKAKLIWGNLFFILLRSMRPTKSVIWAPSYEPIVTSNRPPVLVHVASSWKSMDLRAFSRSFLSRSDMGVRVSAKVIAWLNKSSEIEG